MHGDLCKNLGIDSSTDQMIGIRSVLESIPKCLRNAKLYTVETIRFVKSEQCYHLTSTDAETEAFAVSSVDTLATSQEETKAC